MYVIWNVTSEWFYKPCARNYNGNVGLVST